MWAKDKRFDSLLSCVFSRELRSKWQNIPSSIFEDDYSLEPIIYENDINSISLSRKDWFSIIVAIMLGNRNEVNRRNDGSPPYGRVLIYKDSHISFASKFMGLSRLDESPYLSYLRMQDGEKLLSFSPITIVEKVLQKDRNHNILSWTCSKNGDVSSSSIYNQILSGFKTFSNISGIGFNEELFDNVIDGIMPDSKLIIIKPLDLTITNITKHFEPYFDKFSPEKAKIIKTFIEGYSNNSKYTDEKNPNFQFPQFSPEHINSLKQQLTIDIRSMNKRKSTTSFSANTSLLAYENFGRIIHSNELKKDGMYGLLCDSLLSQYPIIGEKYKEVESIAQVYKNTNTTIAFVSSKYGQLVNTVEHFLNQSISNSYNINPHNPKWMMHISSFDHRKFSSTASCKEKCKILLRDECMSKEELKNYVNDVLSELSKETETVRCGRRIYREIAADVKEFA